MSENLLTYLLPLGISLTRYFLFAGVPFLIFYWLFPKLFRQSKLQESTAPSKGFLREIIHSIQTSCILVAVGVLILETPLIQYTQFYAAPDMYSEAWIFGSVLLSLVVHDTYFYWMHRVLHHPILYKRFHFVHHQSINPSPWASYSFHFVEGILEALIVPILLVLIPLHPLALLLFTGISFAINVYGHLGYEIAPKWLRHSFFFKIINTSVHHNLHHSSFRGNYGLYFRFWDKVMGTENPQYVQEYDAVQASRFKPSEVSAPS
ncbi:MAG: sterol desaturase family protein [Aureispira sp.]